MATYTIDALQNMATAELASALKTADTIDFGKLYAVDSLVFVVDYSGALHIRQKNNGYELLNISNWLDYDNISTFTFGSDTNKTSYAVENATTVISDKTYNYLNLINKATAVVYTDYFTYTGKETQTVSASDLQKKNIITDAGADTVALTNSTNNKVAVGDNADRVIIVGGNQNSVNGEAGNDMVTGISGMSHTLVGGADADVVRSFNTQSNVLSGGEGNDILTTYGGNNNVLAGDAGNDIYKVMTALKEDMTIVIDQSSATTDDTDNLVLAKVSKNGVKFATVGKDLQITDSTTGGKVIVQGWDANPLTKIIFKDGIIKSDAITTAILTGNNVTYTGANNIQVSKGDAMYKEENFDSAGNISIRTYLLHDVSTGVTGGLELDEVYGAYSDSEVAGNVNSNTVTLENVVANQIKGGYTTNGTASDNVLTLTDTYVQVGAHDDDLIAGVIGGQTLNGSADNNIITLSGGEYNAVNASRATTGAANNKLVLQDDVVIEDIGRAGHSSSGALDNNAIIMSSGSVKYLQGARGKASDDTIGQVASKNSVTMTGGSTESARGADMDYGTAVNNFVDISNGATVGTAAGTRIRNGSGSADSNSVAVTDATVGYAYGAQVNNYGNATGNGVILTGTGAVQTTTGSYNFVEYNTRRTVTKNKDGSYTVNVDNSETHIGDSGTGVVSATGSTTANWVYGGFSNNGSADSNTIELTNAVVTNRVYGGYTNNGSSANGNKVTLKGSYVGAGTYSDLNNVNVGVMGGFAAQGTASNNEVSISGGQVANVTAGRSNGNGVVDHNTLTLSGTVVEGYAVAGRANAADATNNTVTATNTKATGITGGRVGTTDVDGYKADNNHVKITGGNVQYVTGGDANRGAATNNDVTLNGVTVNMVRGGRSRTVGDASGNTVTLENGATANYVRGGEVNNYGDATGNTVIVDKSTVTSQVEGGYSSYGSTVKNSVTLQNNATAKYVFGGEATDSGEVAGNTVTINKSTVTDFVVSGWSGSGAVHDNIINIVDGTVAMVHAGNFYDGSGYDNTVNISGASKVTYVYGAAGRDYINVGGASEVTNIYGYAGDDEITINGGTIRLVSGGLGSDKYQITWSEGKQLTIDNSEYVDNDADAFTITNMSKNDFASITYTQNTKSLTLTDKAGGALTIKLANDLSTADNFAGITFSDGKLVAKQDLTNDIVYTNVYTFADNAISEYITLTTSDLTYSTTDGATKYYDTVKILEPATSSADYENCKQHINFVLINGDGVRQIHINTYYGTTLVIDDVSHLQNIALGAYDYADVNYKVEIGAGGVSEFDYTNSEEGVLYLGINASALSVQGSSHDDYLAAIGTNQVMYGNAGDDILTADGNGNKLYGGEGNDYFVSKYSQDATMSGGAGSDTFNISWRLGSTLNIDTQSGYVAGDVDTIKIASFNSSDFKYAFDATEKLLTLTDSAQGVISIKLTGDLTSSANFTGITFNNMTLTAEQIAKKISEFEEGVYVVDDIFTSSTSLTIDTTVSGFNYDTIKFADPNLGSYDAYYALLEDGSLQVGWRDENNNSMGSVVITNFNASTITKFISTSTNSETGVVTQSTVNAVKNNATGNYKATSGNDSYLFTGKDWNVTVSGITDSTLKRADSLDMSAYQDNSTVRYDVSQSGNDLVMHAYYYVNNDETENYGTVTIKDYFTASSTTGSYAGNEMGLRVKTAYRPNGSSYYTTTWARLYVDKNADGVALNVKEYMQSVNERYEATNSKSARGIFLATGSGNDTITAGEGRDYIMTGGGADVVYVNNCHYTGTTKDASGNIINTFDDSYVTDQSTDDTSRKEIFTGGGDDQVYIGNYETEHDTWAKSNNNYVRTGAGDDYLKIAGDYNNIGAGDDNDTIEIRGGNNYINGGTGNDKIVMWSSGTWTGGTNNSGGNNTVQAGAGDDVIYVRNSNWGYITGDAGNDTYVLQFNRARYVVLNNFTAAAGDTDKLVLAGVDTTNLADIALSIADDNLTITATVDRYYQDSYDQPSTLHGGQSVTINVNGYTTNDALKTIELIDIDSKKTLTYNISAINEAMTSFADVKVASTVNSLGATEQEQLTTLKLYSNSSNPSKTSF